MSLLQVLKIMFNLKSPSCVSKTIAAVADALSTHFVPKYLGFKHKNREDLIRENVPRFTSKVLSADAGQAVAILDGTYLYIDQPSDFGLQRKTYSSHKYRNLIKTMMVSLLHMSL